MRLVNRFYVLVTILPLLLLALVLDLRLPAQRLQLPWQQGNAEMGFVPIRSIDYSRLGLSETSHSLDGQIWAVANGIFPGHLKRFQSDAKGKSRPSGKMLALAHLSEQYPNNALLLVQALIQNAGSDGRVAGPWEDDWNQSSLGSPHPKPINNYTTGEMELGWRLARRGQKLEPQNSFFDWAEARFLFAMRRDAEAEQVLMRASQKTGYDLHWREFWSISLSQRTNQRSGSLLPEEKVISAFSTLLPHLSWLRHVTDMALWNAMQKEEAGDVAGAMALQGALARLTMRRTELSFMGMEQICGVRDMQRIWGAPEEMRRARTFYANKSPYKEMPEVQKIADKSQQFIGYCQIQNRNDLARETKLMASRMVSFQKSIDRGQNRDGFMNYTKGTSFTWVCLWWFATTIAVWHLMIALGLWLFFSVLGPLLPPQFASVPPLSSRPVVYPIALGVMVSVGLVALGALFLCQGWAGGMGFCGPNNNGAQYAFICACMALGPPFLFSVLTNLAVMTRLKRAYPAAPTNSRREWENLGGQPHTYDIYVWFWQCQAYLWFYALPLVALGCVLILAKHWFNLLGLVGGTRWMELWNPPYQLDNVFIVLFNSLWIWLVALLARWRFGMPREQRGVAFAGFQALRRAQAWMIPISLWLIVVALWGGVPARQEMDRQWNVLLNSENQVTSRIEQKEEST